MSETTQRRLERRFKETGSIDDEVAVLRERVRLGERKTLEHAAWLGYEPARRAMNYQGETLTSEPVFGRLILDRMGSLAYARAAIAAAKFLQPVIDSQAQELYETGLQAAESTVLDRSYPGDFRTPFDGVEFVFNGAEGLRWSPHEAACGHAYDKLRVLQTMQISPAQLPQATRLGVNALEKLLKRLGPLVFRRAHGSLDRSLDYASMACKSAELSQQDLYEAVVSELVPQLLGYHDPVLQRYEARPSVVQQSR